MPDISREIKISRAQRGFACEIGRLIGPASFLVLESYVQTKPLCIACLVYLFAAAAAVLHAAPAVTVFATNFDDQLFEFEGVHGEITGAGRPQGVEDWWGLGHGSNIFSGRFLRNSALGNPAPATTLRLEGLPRHESIDIHFLLALIDSWDGDAGPDRFNVTLDGAVLFSETFSNPGVGSYFPRPDVELAAGVQLGFTGGDFVDAAYDFGRDPAFSGIPHTASIATISWLASGLGYQGGDDESFAIDNLQIRLGGTLFGSECDLNDDGRCDATDIDLLSVAVLEGSQVSFFDLDGDGSVTANDQTYMVHELMHTFFGDADLDGEFNSKDIVQALAGGKYERTEYATWSKGDWNADLVFNSGDLVAALADGGYEAGPRPATVPEPSAMSLIVFGVTVLCVSRGLSASRK